MLASRRMASDFRRCLATGVFFPLAFGIVAGASCGAQSLAAPANPVGSGFTLQPYVIHAGASRANSVAIGDVTGDGRADVVVASTDNPVSADAYQLFVYAQNTAGNLGPPQRYPYLQQASNAGLALLDLDGIGGLDVVVGGNDGSTRFLSRVDGGLTAFQPMAGRGITSLMALDLDGNGRADLVSAGWDGGGEYLINGGTGVLSATSWNHAGGAWSSLGHADMDADGHEDVVALSPLGMLNNLYIFGGNQNGQLVEHSTHYAKCSTSSWAWGAAVGDVNADGNADIIVSGGGNVPSSCLLVFSGHGDGTFSNPVQIDSLDLPKTVVVADINRDDRDDVIVLHDAWMSVGIYLQNAKGGLDAEVNYPLPYASYGPQALAVADTNSDGCPDVAVADSLHGLVVLKGTGCNRIFRNGFDSP